jgi:hypothetical protein
VQELAVALRVLLDPAQEGIQRAGELLDRGERRVDRQAA